MQVDLYNGSGCCCCRELHKLDSVTRTPLLSHCVETVAGLRTIRAFRSVFVPSFSSLVTEVKKCTEYEVEGSRPRGRPKRTWREVVEKGCQARELNKDDAMDRSTCRWMKLIKDV